MGEGVAEEVLVASAFGGGLDGVNSDFSGSDSPDGRHFQMSQVDLIARRTEILKNGIPLRMIEETISVDPLDSRYDGRIEPLTGRIQLQGASLVDAGSALGVTTFYKSFSTNTGNGSLTVTAASLLDLNAPAETWIVRCVKAVVDGVGAPVPTLSTFNVTGSVSGAVRNAAGDQIVWKSDGVVVSNGTLSFSIVEGSTAFNTGDKFSIVVDSGVLSSSDSLSARYIPESFINDPVTFTDPQELFLKHGQPSAENTLSLGAALAFENGASSVVALQCRPPVPRHTSDTLLAADDPLTTAVGGATGHTDQEDCIFPLSTDGVPDVDLEVNVFVVSADGSEEQIVLNKVPFYDSLLGTTGTQVHANFSSPTYTSSYTIVTLSEVEQSGSDGYIYQPGDGYNYFTAPTANFAAARNDLGEADGNKFIVLFDDGYANLTGKYSIVEIGDSFGDMTVVRISASPVSGTAQVGSSLRWQLVDDADTSSRFALSDDAVTTYLTAGKGLRISYVDTRDSTFFDTNWLTAFESAELVSAQYIVPLPLQTISNIFAVAKTHAITQSNILNGNERILIAGAINGLLPANLAGETDAAVEDLGVLEGIQGDSAEEVLGGLTEDLTNYSIADAFGDTHRAIYMVPDQIVRNIAGANTVLSGYFSAAAMAGFLASKANLAEPSTNKTLSGFTIPNTRRYRPSDINKLLEAGACILEQVAGGGRIVHGITASNSGAPEDEEISVVEIRDQVVRVMRNAMRPFIGRINSPTIVQEISAAADKVLRAMIGQGLLTGFAGLSVSRDQVDATQLNIGVRAFPAGPLNYIFADIEFTLGG
jgi:hypothetical protein